MFNFLANLRKKRIWDFPGGIHPAEMKDQSSHTPLRSIPLAPQFIIPLQQHLGPAGELLVNVGESVLKGQPLTRGLGRTVPVHAPTSGVIQGIAPHVTAHPSGLSELCVHLVADGEDRWYQREPVTDYHQLDSAALLTRLQQAGIAGLGGAGFPTVSKLQGALDKNCQGIDTLILNAAECEPYITADDRLMREHAAEVIVGTQILCHILRPRTTLIGIEDNKPEAIAALQQALRGQQHIELRVIPTKYPSGGAKQLTKILTGREVPYGKHAIAIGVLMQNVGTAFAIKRAIIDGEPLIERVVTLTGGAIKQPGNVWVRLGTPVEHLLNSVGYQPSAKPMVIMGGPLMGFTLPDLQVPMVKISNCILVPQQDEMAPSAAEQACIRCSLCTDACPAGLLPQQLYWFSRGDEHEKARQHHIFDCIECGACAYVCPSNIPLVQYYRQEKAQIRALDQENNRAAEAKLRFEAKQNRMEREKLAREQRHQQAAAKLQPQAEESAIIQAALTRVQQEKPTSGEPTLAITGTLPDNRAAIAARERRKAQRRQEAPPTTLETPVNVQNQDPRQAAVAAAIARVKAKKAAQQSAVEIMVTPTEEVTPSPVAITDLAHDDDPRKAAVTAAIARIKAKKAAQQSGE